MTELRGATVLVTGGASGIGALLGERVLDAGAARLVIWDVSQPALAERLDTLAARGLQADGFVVDITDAGAVQRVFAEMSARSIHPDILVNNAGVVVAREFSAHTHDEIERSMRVNALAPMHLARELLPGMLQRGRGHIVNIASAAGLVSNPRMSVYCASKWAMVGWSESLRLEMERGGHPIRVTTVMPYYVDTGMFAGVRSPVIPILRAEAVVSRIITALRRDDIIVRLPWIVNALPLVRGLLPVRWFDRVVGDWLGVYESMKTFTGRPP